jgi:1-acyl-sn-glycerol-3-phosphate acyltransferase
MRELDGAVSGYLKEYGYAHFFPEGHEGWSYKNQQLNKFNTGAFFFALELGFPVLPVVIVHFATRIFGREYSKLPRRVVTVVLPPIDPAPYREAHDGLNKAASAMAEDVRHLMQEEIDRRHAVRDGRWRDRAATRETG